MNYLNNDSIELIEKSKKDFLKQDPFPFIVIDNFLDKNIADRCLDDFKNIKNGWIDYKHFNQNKRGNKDYINHDFFISSLTRHLNSKYFLDILENLTGYKDIVSDSSLDGGGLHEIKNGGYLNVHTDFQNHTNFVNYKRKLNLLLYFNKNINNLKNSELEFWDASCSKMITKIEPKFNRCVIFSTLDPSFHGHPNPLITNEDESRKSLALYYYQIFDEDLPIQSTNYKSTPHDSIYKKILINLDNKILNFYSFLKRKNIITDELFSKIINIFRKKN